MKGPLFSLPDGQQVVGHNLDEIRTAVLLPDGPFWDVGSGDASIAFSDQEGSLVLLILPHPSLGIYLKHLKKDGGRVSETWLSLNDRSRLAEFAECGDELFVSMGLFLRPESAWLAVQHFVESGGGRTDQIDWIAPSEVPSSGNW